MYHFFLHTAETTLPCLLPIRKTTPNPLHANSMRGKLHIALWLLLTGVKRGEYYLYELLKDGKVVSTAEVCTGHWQLPFLTIRMGAGKKDYHIGPCMTCPNERGKGYYPMLLQAIMNDLGTQNNYYMIVHETNAPSLRGIAKAGFTRIGVGGKNKYGQYIITKKD